MRGLCQGIFRQWLSREVFSRAPTFKWIVPTPDFLKAAVEQRQDSVLAWVLLWVRVHGPQRLEPFQKAAPTTSRQNKPKRKHLHETSRQRAPQSSHDVLVSEASNACLLLLMPTSTPPGPPPRVIPTQPIHFCIPHCWCPGSTQISWTFYHITAFQNTTGAVSYKHQFFLFLSFLIEA